NLVDDPLRAKDLGRLRATLDTWIVESQDQGRTPESLEIVEYWERQMRVTYDARIASMLERRSRRREER
ncbi:MAG: hypothetical protein VX471_07705, partial [Acidobacteriota bacterium]|nr:hypothetical protein [Acidobacteriota bacterium]